MIISIQLEKDKTPQFRSFSSISSFSEDDKHSIFYFMKETIELAASVDGLMTNASIIVDPMVQQVIARGCDAHHECTGIASNLTMACSNLPDKSKRVNLAVSCLNPWQWSQSESECSHYQHPLRHAAMVAIENSSDRDRRMFHCLGHTVHHKDGPSGEEADSGMARPYLCTGYDIYLAWEPCVMCAMALVHQRIRRIFFAFKNPNAGALGSTHRLQGEKGLNHHYAVFRVAIPHLFFQNFWSRFYLQSSSPMILSTME